jgi:hypothetical protein
MSPRLNWLSKAVIDGLSATGMIFLSAGYASLAVGRLLGLSSWFYIFPVAMSAAAGIVAARGSWALSVRRHRRKLGCCPDCGYELTGNTSGVCPECGTAATGRA